jgi:hypothetical protein
LHAALGRVQADGREAADGDLAGEEGGAGLRAGQGEPIRLARNNLGLKLLQYARDEAHRFAQHYHHILRRKSQLEEDVKQGRRPPRRKAAEEAAARPGRRGRGGVEGARRNADFDPRWPARARVG